MSIYQQLYLPEKAYFVCNIFFFFAFLVLNSMYYDILILPA